MSTQRVLTWGSHRTRGLNALSNQTVCTYMHELMRAHGRGNAVLERRAQNWARLIAYAEAGVITFHEAAHFNPRRRHSRLKSVQARTFRAYCR